jgi:ATP synthase protein I
MTERKPPHSLEELDARVREAQRRQAGEGRARQAEAAEGSALGMAWRVGLELVSALVVGVAIGYLLDRWLGTKPWLLILFFVLGSAAGLLNVFRLMSGLGGAIGYRKGPTQQPSTGAKKDEGEDEDE